MSDDLLNSMNGMGVNGDSIRSTNPDEPADVLSQASDDETPIFVDREPRVPGPKDTWVGEKHFESVLATDLLAKANPHESVPNLESKFQAVLLNYPFSQCCGWLTSNGIGENVGLNTPGMDYREILLCWVGLIVRQGSKKEKNLVNQGLCKYVPAAVARAVIPGASRSPAAAISRPHVAMAQARPAQVAAMRETPLPVGGGVLVQQTGRHSPMQDIERYTSLLYEYGQHHDIEPRFTHTQDPNTINPFFRCTVAFGTFRGSGSGKQKTIAKHQASFSVCQQLNIGPD